ncbi:MAG: BTAD domain-containing putative transcriptional regulator [bacterium]|nr:BTAD domain-containing putative transcriptional regulator [bacterium]
MNQKNPAKKRSAKKKSKHGHSGAPAIEYLPSLQSMESLLTGIGGRSRRSAVDEAQEIMYDAWEAPTRQRAVALAKKALTISADCADAYNLLAEETAKSLGEAIDLYRKGVGAGERALGKKSFKEDVGYFWGLLETRPYMRARAGLAQGLWEAGQREEAVNHYWDMLRLNPNDNQGIRDLLMPCLIELGRDKDAERLFKQHKEDGTAAWLYSRALLDFRKHGDSTVAGKSLRIALEENEHVPPYLLGRKRMPRNLPELYSFGDDNEAVLYVHGNKTAWKTTRGAMEWLAAEVK